MFLKSNQQIITDSNNSLAPNRRQAITCTNGDQVHWLIHVSPETNEFKNIEETFSAICKY